ncbi:TauD/TfdA dioxygenase family protein [Ponticaulis koreensis]|uniref:TauD/TfdA dioxygenase family protein n=1 Tax=Ponticaulis koreensis TaxID=1123045 RepID=UPI0003B5007B|nr:TauD/TfdA family dioxygenase [Ponticaulis koreensis]
MTVNVNPADFTFFEIKQLSPMIGAELSGLKLSGDLPDAAISEIRRALLEFKVVFFRDQHELTAAEHIAFARRFGDLEIHPATPKGQEDPEILRITHDETSKGRENAWHSDVTWRPEPSLGSILRAREVPPFGGDTLFSCMYAAYDALSPAMKDWVSGLAARHDIARVFADRLNKSIEELHAQYPVQEHPVVRTHPETGRRALYVNTAFTDQIVGLSKKESDWLLAHLYTFAAVPEHQCRFRWEAGSLAFWDNRACQHYAASDYFPQRRVMERVTIAGDRPFFDPER